MEFEVGKWYKYEHGYKKFKKLIAKRFYYSEDIYKDRWGKYSSDNINFASGHEFTLLTDLSEIQQYLPDGHVDKDIVDEYMEIIEGKEGKNYASFIVEMNAERFGYYSDHKIKERIIKVLKKGIHVDYREVSLVYGVIGGTKVCFNAEALKPSTKEEYEAQFNVKKDSKGRVLKEFKPGEWYTNPLHTGISDYCRIGSCKIGFSNGNPGYYYTDFIFDALADAEWNITENLGIKQANDDYEQLMVKVEQPIKEETKYDYEVVHCTTQEEFEFVQDKTGYKFNYRNFDNNRECCINYSKQLREDLDYYQSKNSLILSFQEWCDKFNHVNPFVKQEPTEDTCKQCADLYFDGSVNTNQHNLCEGSHCGDMLEIQEEKMEINEFKKGDYIVGLVECYSHTRNNCFKMRKDASYLQAVLDNRNQNDNGDSSIEFTNNSSWRYATDAEIAEYNRLGKPYDVSTLKQIINLEGRYLKVINDSHIRHYPCKIGDYLKFKGYRGTTEYWGNCNSEFKDNSSKNSRYFGTNAHKNSDNFELMPEGFEPNKVDSMEDLLREAKEHYPIGTVANCLTNDYKETIDIDNYYIDDDKIIAGSKLTRIYKKGKWAEIISTLETKEKSTKLTSLPEKWCILRNKDNYGVINQWFIDNGYGRPCLQYEYIKISDARTNYGSYSNIPKGYTEISFDQFKQWVMKESIEDVIPEYVEATEDHNSYFKKGIIYKVIDSKSKISVAIVTNIKSGNYSSGHMLYVDFTENIYKPSTKESFDLQNSKSESKLETFFIRYTDEITEDLFNQLKSKLDSLYGIGGTHISPCNYTDFKSHKVIRSFVRDLIDSTDSWCIDNNIQTIPMENEKTIWDFIDKPVDMKEEYKIRDWVTITKSVDNWNDKMDNLAGKTVKITKVYKNSSGFEIQFEGSYGFTWQSWNKHFRKALPHEIPNSKPVLFHIVIIKQSKENNWYKVGEGYDIYDTGINNGRLVYYSHETERCSFIVAKDTNIPELTEKFHHNQQYPRTLDQVFKKEDNFYKTLLVPLSTIY